MSTQIQRRRGTTEQHSTFTGALGEWTHDTDKNVVVVHDGATAGGHAMAREDSPNLTGTPTAPTPDEGDESTRIATAEFVAAAIAASRIGGFSADMGGTNSITAASSTFTKLMFTNELADEGGFYDAANAKWTPPAGRYRVVLNVQFDGCTQDNSSFLPHLYKNGASIKKASVRNNANTNGFSVPLIVDIEANGSDFFEAYFVHSDATTAHFVSGDPSFTWLSASRIG